MATPIDALVVTLGLDAKPFKAGIDQATADQKRLRDESAKTAVELEARGKQAAQFFSQVKNEALGLIGVLLGGKGIETFARSATVALADLGRQAQNIGVAVPQLAAFRNMIERNGGTAEAATSSMKGYADQIERFRLFGDAKILGFLNPLHADITDDPLAVYMKFVKYVQDTKGLPNGVQLINQMGLGLGYDQGLINATIQIGNLKKAQQELAESYRIGVPTKEMSDRMQQLEHDFIGLKQAAEGAGNVLLDQMAPGLSAVARGLTDIVANDPKALAILAGVTAYLTTIAGLNFGAVMAFLARIFPTVALPLALSGDSGPNSGGVSPEQEAINRQRAISQGYQTPWQALKSWWNGDTATHSNASPSLLNLKEQQRIAGIRDSLSSDLGISRDAAAGIMANIWAESGARGINEANPTVPGSRGGFGWAQWTGPRRLAFEEWAKGKGLDPASDQANYGYLVEELKTKYPRILQQLQAGKISASEAANVFYQYESGGDPALERNRAGHVVNADQIAGFTPGPGARVGPLSSAAPVAGASTSITIGSVIVNTTSGNGAAIARDIHRSLADELTSQSNRGLQ